MKTDRCGAVLCCVYVLTVSHTVPVFPEEERSQRLTNVSTVLENCIIYFVFSPLAG